MNKPSASDTAYDASEEKPTDEVEAPVKPEPEGAYEKRPDKPKPGRGRGRKRKDDDREDKHEPGCEEPGDGDPGKPDDRPDEPGTDNQHPREVLDPCRSEPATPYLVIRSWPEDLGVRPIPPGDDVNLTFSPDVPFVPETFPDGSFSLRTWVTNVGLAPAAPAQIEFFLVPPSITQPAVAPFLVATEYAVIQPQTSVLITSRRLNFPDPFGGGLAQGVVVRCSTPFDRNLDTLDPALDRHVATMNAWPITDQGSSIDFNITNWFDSPSEGRVDIAIERLHLTGGSGSTEPAVRRRFSEHDLLNFDSAAPDIGQHLQALRRERRVSTTYAWTVRRALRGRTAQRSPGVERLSTSAGLNQIDLDLEVLDTRRKVFPTRQDVRAFSARSSRTGCRGLAQGRQVLIERIEFGALEERKIRLSLRPTIGLREDEYIVVHLFHLSADGETFLGRIGLIVGSEPSHAQFGSRSAE